MSLKQYMEVRGLIGRATIARQLARGRGSTIIELRGGAGWGKTSAALAYAAERHLAGTQVIVIDDEDSVRICPGAPDGALLYVIDDCTIADDVASELIARAQNDERVQVIVCSRVRHPLIQRAQAHGLVVRTLDLGNVRLTAPELQEIAQMRGLHLDLRRAEYVVHAAGGWPIVARGFLDLYASGRRDASLSSIDQLVTQSFESTIRDLLGEGSLSLLVRASLTGGIRPGAADENDSSAALHRLVERVRQLGLGEWVSA